MKSKNVILVLVVVIMFLSIITFHGDVYACDCAFDDSTKEAFEKADAVFSGVVTKTKEEKLEGVMYDAVLIQVKKTWKGMDETQAIVYTDWSDCRFEFQEGKEYLLYSYESNNRLKVNICSRSSLLSEASIDLQELGVGKEPSHEVNLEDQFIISDRNYPVIILGGAVGAVLLVALGRIVWKVKKK